MCLFFCFNFFALRGDSVMGKKHSMDLPDNGDHLMIGRVSFLLLISPFQVLGIEVKLSV